MVTILDGLFKRAMIGQKQCIYGFSDLKGTQVLLSQMVYRVDYDVQERELITYLIHSEKTTKPCSYGWTHVLLMQTKGEIDLGASNVALAQWVFSKPYQVASLFVFKFQRLLQSYHVLARPLTTPPKPFFFVVYPGRTVNVKEGLSQPRKPGSLAKHMDRTSVLLVQLYE